jgi:hypothetical protein
MAAPASGTIKGFLTTIGYIDNNGKVTHRLGYLTNSPDTTQAARLQTADQSPVVVAQIDAVGASISSYLIPAVEVHADVDAGEFYFFCGKLPLDANTSQFTLSRDGVVFVTVNVPANAPVIQLTWTPPVGGMVGPQLITWNADHPDGLPLEFLVQYSSDGGATFRQLSPSISDKSFLLNFDQLPGGTCQVMVLATDGANTTSATSAMFQLPVRPPMAMLLAPLDKSTFDNPIVTLQGQGYYLEEDLAELRALTWTSSVDGALGTGRVIQPKLSPGTHTITLVVGQGARASSASITINVSQT